MGLNRIYTFGGSPLKNADGNPIGYEWFPFPNDYISYYLYEDNLNDVTGSFNMNNTITGGTITYSTGGPNAPGTYMNMAFEGAGNRIDSVDFQLNTENITEFSYCGWFRGHNSAVNQIAYSMGKNTFYLLWLNSQNAWYTQGVFNDKMTTMTSKTAWYHFGMVYTATNIKFYLNGNTTPLIDRNGSYSVAPSFPAYTWSHTIGQEDYADIAYQSAYSYASTIIYDRVITAAEYAQIYEFS